MMLLRWVVMPARPGPADARDAPGGPGACLTSVADAPDDVVSAMPARPRPADAHAALAVGLPPCGRLWLMLMMLCGSCRTAVASSDDVVSGGDACKSRAS